MDKEHAVARKLSQELDELRIDMDAVGDEAERQGFLGEECSERGVGPVARLNRGDSSVQAATDKGEIAPEVEYLVPLALVRAGLYTRLPSWAHHK